MTKAISIRIDTDLLDYLQNRADMEHRTLSNMVSSILMNDKAEHGRPDVEVGDTIKCRHGQAVITSIDDEAWSIKWDNGNTDTVPMLQQHNWKRV